MLSSGSPQEAHDLAVIAQVASRRLRSPFLHFFETPSGETTVKTLSTRQLEEILSSAPIEPEGGEISSQQIATVVTDVMTKLAPVLGRQYKPFSYYGNSEATHLIVSTGDASVITEEVIALLAVRSLSISFVVCLIKTHRFR